jgi:hypothetical protein
MDVSLIKCKVTNAITHTIIIIIIIITIIIPLRN